MLNEGEIEMTDDEQSNAIGVGMAIAAGIVMSCWGDEVAAREILGAAALTSVKDLREAGVDWYDIRLLVPVLRYFRDRDHPKPQVWTPFVVDTTPTPEFLASLGLDPLP
jgi:hypothetical protein